MTKDEIKTALERCNRDDCINCPYISYSKCRDILIDAALNLITEQEEHIKIQNQQLSNWEKNYTQSFERLKAQQREIDQLKAENDTNMKYIRMMGIQSHIKTSNEQVKQAKIDVLNKVKNYIDDKIENDYGDMSDSVKYLTVDIDDFDDFIDELIKEVENEN